MASIKLTLCGYLILILVQLNSSNSLEISVKSSYNNEIKTTTQPESYEDQDYVPLDELPEPFIQAKLPGAETDTDWCDNEGHIGCFRRLRGLPEPEQPEKMKAAFSVYSKKQEVLIEYKPTKHCLKKNTTQCGTYPYNLSLIKKSKFNPEIRTIIVVPGFKSGQFDQFLIDIRKGWVDLENVNVIMVAWTGGNKAGGLDPRYPEAAANTRVVARQISVLLYYFGVLKSNYQLSDDNYVNQVSMVGHSLGAHISGFVGKDLSGALGSIAGLDPARPNFLHTISRARLDRSDALLVQTIHTNTERLGLPEAIGNLDFYANEGTKQPGCGLVNISCSHSRSHEYYISLLKHEKRIRDLSVKFPIEEENHKLFAYQSKDYRQFIDGTSRRKLCPKSVLDDKTFDRSDINKCITPMDFVSEPQSVMENLKSYGIDVVADSEAGKSRKFYFHTQDDPSYLNNHFTFKIFFLKDRKVGAQCKINVDIKLPNGKVQNYKVGYYSLYENQGHLEANIPVLGSDLESKYSLAEVDGSDYYTSDLNLLERKAKLIFPNSIRIKGRFIGHNQTNANENDITDWCNLQIECIRMEPLNKLNRYFSATFSAGAKGKKYPDVVFSENFGSLHNQKKELVTFGAASDVFLDTVVVGPSKIVDMTSLPTAPDTHGSNGTIASISMIFIGAIVVGSAMTIIYGKLSHRSNNSLERQPIVSQN